MLDTWLSRKTKTETRTEKMQTRPSFFAFDLQHNQEPAEVLQTLTLLHLAMKPAVPAA